MVHSLNKGKAAERAWAAWIRDNLSISAKRGASQGFGASCRPDVEVDLPIHFECKHVENLAVHKAMDQALRDCRPGHIPVVAHKKNRTPWMITLLATDLVEFCEIIANRKKDCD